MFTLDQLRTFVTVAEEMHFGRAAQRLNMTQPPLSRQVQALERDLGVELIDRTRRTIRLTAAGEVFLLEARRLLALTIMASSTAQRASLGLTGTIHVGFTSVVGHALLPEILRRAAEELPDVELILHEMVTAEQLRALHTGTIDVGMVRPTASSEELTFRRLPPDRLLVAYPRSWDLPLDASTSGDDEPPRVKLSTLHDRPFVMYAAEESRYFHQLVSAIFNLNGIVPRYAQRVAQVHTMLSLVNAGIGAALVPASARSWASPETVVADSPQLAPFPTESNLAWRTDSSKPALAKTLELILSSQ